MTCLTSCIRIFAIGGVIWCGASNAFVMISSSVGDRCDGNGLKTEARCLANAVAFCLSVRAQVVLFTRSGGM